MGFSTYKMLLTTLSDVVITAAANRIEQHRTDGTAGPKRGAATLRTTLQAVVETAVARVNNYANQADCGHTGEQMLAALTIRAAALSYQ